MTNLGTLRQYVIKNSKKMSTLFNVYNKRNLKLLWYQNRKQFQQNLCLLDKR